MNPYEFMFPKIDGRGLEKDPTPYLRLVEKGVSGFILFGGCLEAVRDGLNELQRRAALPLIIASDLERGLGQQVEGGTVFPSAMAFGSASEAGMNEEDLGRAFSAFAEEARWAGINMIFAPVLDINSNPQNPIISTRAFGEQPETVSRLGVLMAKRFEQQGVYACGKHFPGHGDTYQDSHLETPAVNKTFGELESFELKPFRAAIRAGIAAIMAGHLRLPREDPSGLPATLSSRALGYLRAKMGFAGLIITDALNMAGAGGNQGFDEMQRAEMALLAGSNVLLMPSEPDETARYLLKRLKPSSAAELIGLIMEKRKALAALKTKTLPKKSPPEFEGNRRLAREIALNAIKRVFIYGDKSLPAGTEKLIIVLTDDPQRLTPFADELKKRAPSATVLFNPPDAGAATPPSLVVAHSTPRAWKPPSARLKRDIARFSAMGPLWLSLGNPYLIAGERRKVLTYSDDPELQREMAKRVAEGRL